MNKGRSRLILVALGVVGAAAMLVRPYAADHVGQIIALMVWCLLWLVGVVTWVVHWVHAHKRDPEILSGRWAKTKLVLQALTLFAIGFAGALAIGHFG